MEVNINELGECVLLCNLNIQVNKKDNQDTITLLDTLEIFGLQNRVEFPTHLLQKTLDLIIIERHEINRKRATNIRTQPHPFHTSNPIQSHINEQGSYRKTKAIDISLIKSEVLKEILYHWDCNSPDYFVGLYNWSLNQLMDKFTPLKEKKVSDRPKLPWINDTITAEVRKRQLEKI